MLCLLLYYLVVKVKKLVELLRFITVRGLILFKYIYYLMGPYKAGPYFAKIIKKSPLSNSHKKPLGDL